MKNKELNMTKSSKKYMDNIDKYEDLSEELKVINPSLAYKINNFMYNIKE